MKSIKQSATLAFALLCSVPALAQAGEVTFNVPLDLRSFPSPNVEVWCELRTAQNQPLEAGMSVIHVQNGARSGTAQVKVQYLPQEAAALKNYRCALAEGTKPLSGLGGGIGSGEGRANAKSIPPDRTILQQVSGPLQ